MSKDFIQAEYDQDSYDQDQEIFETQSFSDEKNQALVQFPWMAISTAFISALLLTFSLIQQITPERPELEVLVGEVEEIFLPPPPEELKPEEVQFPKDEEFTEEPVVDPSIVDEAVDEENQDPTDDPFDDLAPNPNESDNKSDSPDPRKGPTSNFGVGGPTGGGGGPSGPGGSFYERAKPGGGEELPPRERTDAALQWLADHQAPDGHWSSQHFSDHSIRLKKGAERTGTIEYLNDTEDTGWETVDIGLSGLALLAFAGNGNTHKDGKYRNNVRTGLRWILSQQDSSGCFGARDEEEFVYNHAICTMALVEIYGMNGDIALKSKAQRAVDFIVEAQNQTDATKNRLGWRYGINTGDNDSSVTAWMVLALKSAKLAGLKFPEEEVYAGANNWYDRVTIENDDGYGVTTSYRDSPLTPGNSRLEMAQDYNLNPSMDACAAMVRLFTGHSKSSDKTLKSYASRMTKTSPPSWDHLNIDFYYWYYASLALFQMGDQHWKRWEEALIHPVLLRHQRGFHPLDIEKYGPEVTSVSDGLEAGRWILDEHGSWDPIDAWGSAGGRVYATAINALTLEVYYRYKRVSEE